MTTGNDVTITTTTDATARGTAQARRVPFGAPRGPRMAATLLVAMGGAAIVLSGCGNADGDEQAGSATSTTQTTVVVETTVARDPVTHDFVVPAGTAEAIARDETVEVVPEVLEVHVGDRIRVRNDDTELARLGIFDVGAGETITMNFNTPGELQGIVYADASGGCGAPPADAQTFTIVVQP